MTYNQSIAQHITDFFNQTTISHHTTNILNGLFFMVNNKTCCGLYQCTKKNVDILMFRIGEASKQQVQHHKNCYTTDFSGRMVKDYIFVTVEASELRYDLTYWLGLCLDFNAFAKATRHR